MANTRELPIKITEAERNHKAREATDKRHQAKLLQTELDDYSKPKKAAIKALEDEADILGAAASTGELKAQVEVEEVKNFDVGDIRLVRRDTGETVEGPRAMTAKERQTADLRLGGDPEGETASTGSKRKVKLNKGGATPPPSH